MPVPSSVISLLNNKQVPFHLTEVPEGMDARLLDQYMRQLGAAKAILLQDGDGRLQAVIPADRLLDLNALNRQLGRELKATTRGDLEKFFAKHHLQSIPALPKLAGLPTVVDKQLLDRAQLTLDAGSHDQFLQVDQAAFQQILSDATVTDITKPLEPLEADNLEFSDEQQITHSVKSFTQRRIHQRLEETLELPPLPETAQRIIKLRVDPNADISDLANIVETDPSLAAQVVSWAASPYYSAPGKIKSIHDAIVRVLGFDMVLNLALGLALGKTLSMPKDGPAGVMPYWKQSVYMAATIEGLVTSIPRESRPSFGMAYLSGLLHNFGYLVMAELFPPQFSTICRHVEANSHVCTQAIDRHILEITREQLSSWLMQLWGMPEEVVVALRQQGNPLYQGEHQEYAKLILVGQRLLQQRGVMSGPKLAIPEQVYKDLNLDAQKAEATLDNILESCEELDNIAGQMAQG